MAIVGVSIGIFFSLVGNSLRLRGKLMTIQSRCYLRERRQKSLFLGYWGIDTGNSMKKGYIKIRCIEFPEVMGCRGKFWK